MLVRLSAATAVVCILSGAVLAQGAAKPTYPQIAHIDTAGQLDIEAAKQALSKSTNTDVRAFAEGMVGDHTAVTLAIPSLRACCRPASRYSRGMSSTQKRSLLS